MKHFIVIIVVLLLLFDSAFNSHAAIEVTPESCRRRAILQSEDLKAEETRRDQADLRTKEHRTHYLPKISAAGYYLNTRGRYDWDVDRALFAPLGQQVPLDTINPLTGRPIDDVSGHHIMKQSAWYTTIRAEQPLYMGGKIRAANKMAEVAEGISLESVEASRQSVIAEADQAYWRFVAVNEQVQAAAAYVDLLDALEGRVSHAVDTGLVHRNELLKVRVRRNEAALDLERARNGSELLRMSLCRIMGYDLATPLEPAHGEIVVPRREEIPAEPDLSVRRRPEYRMLEDKVELNRENERLVRSDYLPQVGVTAGYGYLGDIEVYRTDISREGFYVIAEAKVPIWQWGEGRYRKESAKLDSRLAELDLQKYEKLMELEVQQAFFAMSEAHARCGMTGTGLKQAEASMETSKDFYEVGLETLTDYLESQSRWRQALAEHIAAKAEFKIQETNYLKATGKLGGVSTNE